MSVIKPDQIDELMFDYFEGNLSPSEMKELEVFVESNPEFKHDFDAWKDSYFEAPKDDYPFADQLLAGSGALWMKWAMLGLLLIGTSAAAYVFFGKFDLSPNSTIAEDSAQPSQVVEEFETPNPPSSFEFINEAQESSANGKSESAKVMETEHNKNIESNSGSQSTGFKNYALHTSTTSGNSEEVLTVAAGASSSSTASGTSSSGTNANDASSSNATTASNANTVTELAFGDDVVGTTSNYVGEEIETFESEDYSNLALNQAVAFFEPNGGASSNNFKYPRSFPEIPTQPSGNDRTRATLLSRVIRKISNGMIQQPLGLRNFKDPYFVVPEFYSAISYNSSFTGSYNMLRAKVSTRSARIGSDQMVNSVGVSVDGSLALKRKPGRLSKSFPIGLGLTSITKVAETNRISTLNTESSIHFAPKFHISKTATFEPAINVNYGYTSTNFKDSSLAPSTLELDKGVLVEMSAYGNADGADDFAATRNVSYVDLGLSALINTRHFYLGVKADNLLGAKANSEFMQYASENNMNPTVTAVLGTDYKYSDRSNSSFSPHIVLTQRGNYTDLWTGIHARIGKLMIGAGYGNHAEYAGLLGIQSNYIRLALKADYARSALSDERMLSLGFSARAFITRRYKTNDLPATH